MNQSRFAGRVGLFVFIGLVLMAGLLLTFTKGLTFFRPTYEIKLSARNVGGLRDGANVLLAGIPIGNVGGAEVRPDQKGVYIRLKINSKHQIHGDAKFVIEQIGFLGDQFIAIYPQENKAPVLKPGDIVEVDVPVSIQEVARSASDLLKQAADGLKVLNAAIARVDRTVLGHDTLTNITGSIESFRMASTRGITLMDRLNEMVETNTTPIFIAVSNLARFSEDMDKMAAEMTATVATNRTELTKAVKNLERATAVLERLVGNVEAGSGLAGSLLSEGPLKDEVANVVSNFVVLSSNLNRYGLLYKPRQPRTNVAKPLYPGRSPFR